MTRRLSKFQPSDAIAKIISSFGTLDIFLARGNFSRQICSRGVTFSPYVINQIQLDLFQPEIIGDFHFSYERCSPMIYIDR